MTGALVQPAYPYPPDPKAGPGPPPPGFLLPPSAPPQPPLYPAGPPVYSPAGERAIQPSLLQPLPCARTSCPRVTRVPLRCPLPQLRPPGWLLPESHGPGGGVTSLLLWPTSCLLGFQLRPLICHRSPPTPEPEGLTDRLLLSQACLCLPWLWQGSPLNRPPASHPPGRAGRWTGSGRELGPEGGRVGAWRGCTIFIFPGAGEDRSVGHRPPLRSQDPLLAPAAVWGSVSCPQSPLPSHCPRWAAIKAERQLTWSVVLTVRQGCRLHARGQEGAGAGTGHSTPHPPPHRRAPRPGLVPRPARWVLPWVGSCPRYRASSHPHPGPARPATAQTCGCSSLGVPEVHLGP